MIDVLFVVMCILFPFAVILAYRQGLADKRSVDTNGPLPPIMPFKIAKNANELIKSQDEVDIEEFIKRGGIK